MTLPSGGEGAEYVYDAGGNILQIRPAVAVGVSVADFVPRQGGIGQIVTVFGAGFSPTPSLNEVRVNGVTATVLAATSSELTFTVPSGATTGRIAVTSGGSTGTSADDFTVVPGVVVSDFTPKLGKVGTVLTVQGFNFDPNPLGDSVQIGGGAGPVTSASHTSLLATVSTAATSGKVTVTTSLGTGASAEDFFLLPGDYVPLNVGFTGRAAIASPTTVTTTSAGKAGLVLFDGRQGQFLSLYVSGVTFPGSTNVTVYTPSGASFLTGTVSSGLESKFVLSTLPTTGTYTIAVQPAATSAGKLDLQVFEDAAATLVVGAEASAMVLARGQNGRYTFTGAAGDVLGLACTAFATTPAGGSAALIAQKPDGSYLWQTSMSGPSSWQLPQLSTTGTYSVLVQPTGTAGASLTCLLSQPVDGVLVVDGAPTPYQGTVPGQLARYYFAGNAGDYIGLGVTALTTSPPNAGVNIYIYKPDGSYLGNFGATWPTSFQLPQLPTTGTYKLEIRPNCSRPRSIAA